MNRLTCGLPTDTTLLDAVADPVFIKDAQHRWIYVNPAMGELLRRPTSELIGLSDADLMPLDVYRGYWEEDDRVMSTGLESHKEEDIHEGKHRVRRILTKKRRIQIGGEFYVFGIIRDITDVYQHTRLAHLGEIAGNLSHELMTPLTVMDFHLKNFAETLDDGPINAQDTKQFLNNMEKAKERLLSIIKSVRAFAVDPSDMPMSLTDLNCIVAEAVELAGPRINKRHVTLQVDPIPNVQVLSRGPQIGQIIINLLHNAADAISDLESPWIKVSFETCGQNLEIIVTDKGPGIPPEIADQLMTPFFTTKPSHCGTGLGLSLASKLAAEHGGTLWYDRNSANTCFRLRLPLAS